MTSLLYYYEPQTVFIAMDTLAMTDDCRPYLYTTKFFLLPHMAGMICGTGHGQFVLDWFTKINSGMLALDIPHLDEFTPEQLCTLAVKYGISQASTVTVYQFGYSEAEQCFKGYAYRSKNGFQSELLPYNGIGIKPGVPFESSGPLRIPDDFIKIMNDQRQAEEAKPIQERVFIGGEMHVIYMTPTETIVFRGHRFPEYDSMYYQMCEKLNNPKNEV